jgi:pimeloyl-ACP methyl ester carboxylesterase
MGDAVVTGAGISVAVREFGGSGVPILLLHGAGHTLVDMAPLAGQLTCDHRVVAMDLRNHGRSGEGPWKWDQVLADIRAVVEALELTRPIVVGHSLGGMLAAMYANQFSDITAAVNLDGYGAGRPEDYAVDPADAVQLGELLRSSAEREIEESGRARSAEDIRPLRDGWTAAAGALGLDTALAVEAFDRKLLNEGGGMFMFRPGPQQLRELRVALDGLNLRALYRRCSIPQLLCVATRDQEDSSLPEALRSLIATYRGAVIRELRLISEADPNLRLVELDASHSLIYECPGLIAEQIRSFAAGWGVLTAAVGSNGRTRA